jgi:hypothetical protein
MVGYPPSVRPYQSNILICDHGIYDIQNLVKIMEIAVPPGSEYRNRSPKAGPFPELSDNNVAVTATLVSHFDVDWQFAFRLDLKKLVVSVTFSGNTSKCDNLIRLAQETDILVHEVMFPPARGWAPVMCYHAGNRCQSRCPRQGSRSAVSSPTMSMRSSAPAAPPQPHREPRSVSVSR